MEGVTRGREAWVAEERRGAERLRILDGMQFSTKGRKGWKGVGGCREAWIAECEEGSGELLFIAWLVCCEESARSVGCWVR